MARETYIFSLTRPPRRGNFKVTSQWSQTKWEVTPNKNFADFFEQFRQAISNLAADWLMRAGITVPRDASGEAAAALEISPLYALDAEEFARKVDGGLRIEGRTYLGEPDAR